MSSHPDILVTAADSPRVLVVVDTCLDRSASAKAIQEIRRYMVKMNCPAGLLILPDELYLFRNKYTGADENAIDEVGHYHVNQVFQKFVRLSGKASAQDRGRFFESYVQSWLEHLPKSDDILRLPPDLRDALETHILPAIENGVVRAAGPREMGSNF